MQNIPGSYPKYQAVVFDLDGTLADTIELILVTFEHAMNKVLGYAESRETLRPYIGRTLMATFAELNPEHASELLQTYRAWQAEHHDEYIKPFPGIVELLEKLGRTETKFGVVTAKMRDMASRGMTAVGISSLIPLLIAGEESKCHKPDPQPLLLGLEKLGVPANQACYIGDAVVDVQAAKAAGMTAIAVTWGSGTVAELTACNPDYLVTDIAELEKVLGL